MVPVHVVVCQCSLVVVQRPHMCSINVYLTLLYLEKTLLYLGEGQMTLS